MKFRLNMQREKYFLIKLIDINRLRYAIRNQPIQMFLKKKVGYSLLHNGSKYYQINIRWFSSTLVARGVSAEQSERGCSSTGVRLLKSARGLLILINKGIFYIKNFLKTNFLRPSFLESCGHLNPDRKKMVLENIYFFSSYRYF